MARFLCRCGEILSNSEVPSGIELRVYTDREWEQIASSDSVDPLLIPFPKYEVWRCPKCERIYVFEEGNQSAIKVYKLEE
ncbi:hypothetical protein ACFPVX_13540 [Cohnella faecalis]|uniref:Uncharacterized protein n=1 Tax=Cohnella faecalis TaxID=2315694 RepID=A0A398CPB8_9BACL|nr:hypothetical protein [Cohnella faecalis]RIE02558.1 hypothetical protein D3H35_17885 [Cohnella faecalis]